MTSYTKRLRERRFLLHAVKHTLLKKVILHRTILGTRQQCLNKQTVQTRNIFIKPYTIKDLPHDRSIASMQNLYVASSNLNLLTHHQHRLTNRKTHVSNLFYSPISSLAAFSVTFFIKSSIYIRNKEGDMIHPCFRPILLGILPIFSTQSDTAAGCYLAFSQHVHFYFWDTILFPIRHITFTQTGSHL